MTPPVPTPTAEELALARKVLADLEPNRVFAEQYRKGERDGIGTSIALAAIRETTERAAGCAEQYPSTEAADIPVIRGIAYALRTNAHLKGEAHDAPSGKEAV